MNDFLSKLENFLFDILGLILPGAIFLLILMSPILFVDMDKVPEKMADASVLLSALKTISIILKSYWTAYPKSALTIAAILAYLAGHTVKVFSIIQYSFLSAFFDKSLNRLAAGALARLKNRLPLKTRRSKTARWLKDLYKPFGILIDNLFVFKAPYHQKDDDVLMQDCLSQLDTRLSITYPRDDEAVSKISGVIANQESLRTLGTFFLAKYNLYRSLSLIFLFTTLYYIYFFKLASSYISPASREVSSIIFAAPAIFWFTFHVKYKKYWTLYGHERIISLFYFLHKKKLNEA